MLNHREEHRRHHDLLMLVADDVAIVHDGDHLMIVICVVIASLTIGVASSTAQDTAQPRQRRLSR
jgi:hypothetical protein